MPWLRLLSALSARNVIFYPSPIASELLLADPKFNGPVLPSPRGRRARPAGHVADHHCYAVVAFSRCAGAESSCFSKSEMS